MKKIIISLGLLIGCHGIHNSLHAMKRQLTPQEYVMSGLVLYPDIIAIRNNAENKTDAELIAAFNLELYGGLDHAQERLRIIRSLTPGELERKKQDYEMYNR